MGLEIQKWTAHSVDLGSIKLLSRLLSAGFASIALQRPKNAHLAIWRPEYDNITRVAITDTGGARRVSVRVRDLAGNLSNPVTHDLEAGLRREEVRATAHAGGCSSTRGAPLAALVLGLIVPMFWRRRRR